MVLGADTGGWNFELGAGSRVGFGTGTGSRDVELMAGTQGGDLKLRACTGACDLELLVGMVILSWWLVLGAGFGTGFW